MMRKRPEGFMFWCSVCGAAVKKGQPAITFVGLAGFHAECMGVFDSSWDNSMRKIEKRIFRKMKIGRGNDYE